jgi:hypothetical protein
MRGGECPTDLNIVPIANLTRDLVAALRQTVASRHRRFLYSVTVSAFKEEHILLSQRQSVLTGERFMTRCVAHDGLLHHYFNKFDPVVSHGESRSRRVFFSRDNPRSRQRGLTTKDSAS